MATMYEALLHATFSSITLLPPAYFQLISSAPPSQTHILHVHPLMGDSSKLNVRAAYTTTVHSTVAKERVQTSYTNIAVFNLKYAYLWSTREHLTGHAKLKEKIFLDSAE
jgi:hypothetical protein